jgi:hypothetical protein
MDGNSNLRLEISKWNFARVAKTLRLSSTDRHGIRKAQRRQDHKEQDREHGFNRREWRRGEEEFNHG